MSAAFLHGEFFIWMVLPVALLFYFWITQKPLNEHGLREEIVQKLKAPATTLGLKGRNGLFLAASFLMIIALADPVVFEHGSNERREKTIIAIDISYKTKQEFEAQKVLALEGLKMLQGAVSLVAYDMEIYRIAPMSEDKEIIEELINGLSYRAVQKSGSDTAGLIQRLVREPSDDTAILIVGAKEKGMETRGIYSAHNSEDFSRIQREIAALDALHDDEKNAIPLFYYPLGMAMILIAVALFSMSKREKVVLAFLLIVFIGEKDVRANLLPSNTLRDAYQAYERHEYERSAKLFRMYKEENDTPEIRYNYANALLMAGHYEQARYWYGQVYTNDPLLQRYVRHNLASIPLHEEKKATPPSRYEMHKPDKRSKKRRGEKIFLRNATPLFVYE